MSDPRIESEELAELLALARRQRSAERAPDDLRARARARVLAEAAVPAAHALPVTPLVSIARPSLRFGLRMFGVAALVLGAIIGAPLLLRTVSKQWAQGPEPASSANAAASGPAAELLLHSSPLASLPLLPLPEDQPAVSGPSLLGERPFAQPGDAWQVRRWNDPKAAPDEPAAYGFEDGALCVALGAGERVLGGWPWPAASRAVSSEAVSSEAVSSEAVSSEAVSPEKVPLTQGRAYRLGFRAWVRGPLPSQVLIGIGHIQFPFVAAAAARVQVAQEAERFALDFVAARADDAVGVAFLASNGPHADPTRVCFADVTLVAR